MSDSSPPYKHIPCFLTASPARISAPLHTCFRSNGTLRLHSWYTVGTQLVRTYTLTYSAAVIHNYSHPHHPLASPSFTWPRGGQLLLCRAHLMCDMPPVQSVSCKDPTDINQSSPFPSPSRHPPTHFSPAETPTHADVALSGADTCGRAKSIPCKVPGSCSTTWDSARRSTSTLAAAAP